jgi:hypothetical protein
MHTITYVRTRMPKLRHSFVDVRVYTHRYMHADVHAHAHPHYAHAYVYTYTYIRASPGAAGPVVCGGPWETPWAAA